MRLKADFNGLSDGLLCLSHEAWARDEHGAQVTLVAGMLITAVEPDVDDQGQPDELLASGIVEVAPDWLACKGSTWVLRVDARGVHHASDPAPA